MISLEVLKRFFLGFFSLSLLGLLQSRSRGPPMQSLSYTPMLNKSLEGSSMFQTDAPAQGLT